MPDEREPIPYAGPEQQEPPRFEVHWGGWVLLALLVLAFLVPLWRLLAR